MFSIFNYTSEAVHLKPHSKRLKMRLASLLTGQQICRRNRNDGREEALELVRECEVGANCSEICHKLGKYYNNRVSIIELSHCWMLEA